jgi:hypothetical protein
VHERVLEGAVGVLHAREAADCLLGHLVRHLDAGVLGGGERHQHERGDEAERDIERRVEMRGIAAW